MAFNEKIRSPDVVEVMDVKVFATSDFPVLGTVAGATLEEVTFAIGALSLSPGEKAALDATYTAPSASNPVVLMLDIPVYYHQGSFGNIRDAVSDTSDLPPAVTPTADTTSGSVTITSVSDITGVVKGQQVSGPGIPAGCYVVDVGADQFDINLAATATQSGVTLDVGPATGDIIPVLNAGALYRWDGTSWSVFVHTGVLDHTMLINLNADPNFQHVPLVTLNSLNHNDHIHGFYFDPSDVDVGTSTVNRNTNGYPDGTAVNVLSIGTLPAGLSSTVTYYMVNTTATSFQLSTAPGGPHVTFGSQGTNQTPTGIPGQPFVPMSHILSVLPMLSLITSSGSGAIITPGERGLLHQISDGMLAALLGTAGTPSITNPYVTDFDPRINTIRNPYATVGVSTPPCSYPGSDESAFDAALKGISSFPCTISVGSPAVVTADTIFQANDQVYFETAGTLPAPLLANQVYFVVDSTPSSFCVSTVPGGAPVATTAAGSGDPVTVGGNNLYIKALEVIPGSYTLASPLVWSEQPDGWLLEGRVPGAATVECSTLADAVSVLPPGTGAVTIRGITFSLSGSGTNALNISRDYCTIEDCTFTGADGNPHVGVKLNGSYAHVRRCTFDGTLSTAVEVSGNYCLIEQCSFSLSSPSSYSVDVLAGATGTNILNCAFNSSDLLIEGAYTQLSYNRFTPTASFSDGGTGTRFLENPSSDTTFPGQAAVGAKRTLGPPGSIADYRGSTDAIFATALADPYVSDLEVLPGTYTFSNTVTIPEGKGVRGTSQSDGTAGTGVIMSGTVPSFSMANNTTLADVQFSGAPLSVTIPGATNADVSRCLFSGQGISATSATLVRIDNCTFSGSGGVQLAGCTACTVGSSLFQVTGTAVSSDSSTQVCRMKDNVILGGAVSLAGNQWIVRGNNFLAGVPNKLAALGSVWQGNYPSPEADNYNGSDFATVELGRYLDPYTPGCSRVSVMSFGMLSYAKSGTASASTAAVPLSFAIDKTQPFTVTLHWTSIATSGDVRWRVTVTFADRVTKAIGTPQAQLVTSSRSHLAVQEEEQATISFPSYGLGVMPTNFSVEVTRLPADAADTLPYAADLVGVSATFRRN